MSYSVSRYLLNISVTQVIFNDQISTIPVVQVILSVAQVIFNDQISTVSIVQVIYIDQLSTIFICGFGYFQ
jgi:hypothetical protein